MESIPGKVSGAWVLKGTRMPVSAIFENLEAGANIDDIMEWFDGLDREQVKAVIEFAVRSLDKEPSLRAVDADSIRSGNAAADPEYTVTVWDAGAPLTVVVNSRPPGSGSGASGEFATATFRITSKSSGEVLTSGEVIAIVP